MVMKAFQKAYSLEEDRTNLKPSLRTIQSFSHPSTTTSSSSKLHSWNRISGETEDADMEVEVEEEEIENDIIQGWIYMKYVGTKRSDNSKNSHIPFQRVYCRLREVVCCFYSSENPFEEPLARHILIHVSRIHTINKAFQMINHEDQVLLLHTNMSCDFEGWYGAFKNAIRSTNISKSTSKSGTMRSTDTSSSTGRQFSTSQESNTNIFDPDRSFCGWLYVEAAWWKKMISVKKQRRYFVLSGTTLSCFSLNMEGITSDFTRSIIQIKYNPTQDPLQFDLKCSKGSIFHLSALKEKEIKEWIKQIEKRLPV